MSLRLQYQPDLSCLLTFTLSALLDVGCQDEQCRLYQAPGQDHHEQHLEEAPRQAGDLVYGDRG